VSVSLRGYAVQLTAPRSGGAGLTDRRALLSATVLAFCQPVIVFAKSFINPPSLIVNMQGGPT